MQLHRPLLLISLLVIIASIGITVFLAREKQTITQQAQTPPATNPYQRGADPTLSTITATNGPFTTAQANVPGGNGFKSGVIYYPTDTSQTYGAIAIAPGTTALFKDQEAWMGPRIASFGFVVIGIETSTTTIPYTQRATELLAALDYLTKNSTVKDRVDPNRLATMGHSSGGGGALVAAIQRPTLKTAIGLAPWKPEGDLAELTVPPLIIGGQRDGTVTPAKLDSHWNSLQASLPALYIQVAGGDHVFSATPNAVMMRNVIPWLKIFLDNDTRYTQFICPFTNKEGISLSRDKCSFIPSPSSGITAAPSIQTTVQPTLQPTNTPVSTVAPTYAFIGDCTTNNTCPTVTESQPQPTLEQPEQPIQTPPTPGNLNGGMMTLLLELLRSLFALMLLLFSR